MIIPNKRMMHFERMFHHINYLRHLHRKGRRDDHFNSLKSYIESDDLFRKILIYTYEITHTYKLKKIKKIHSVKIKDKNKEKEVIKKIFIFLDECINYKYNRLKKEKKDELSELANSINYGYEIVNHILERTIDANVNVITLNKIEKNIVTPKINNRFYIEYNIKYLKFPCVNITDNLMTKKIYIYVDRFNNDISFFSLNYINLDINIKELNEELFGLFDVKYDDKYSEYFKNPIIIETYLYYLNGDEKIRHRYAFRYKEKKNFRFNVFNIYTQKDFKNKKQSITFVESLNNPLRKNFKKYLESYEYKMYESRYEMFNDINNYKVSHIYPLFNNYKFESYVDGFKVSKFHFCYLKIDDVKFSKKDPHLVCSTSCNLIKTKVYPASKHNLNLDKSVIGETIKVIYYKIGIIKGVKINNLMSAFYIELVDEEPESKQELLERSGAVNDCSKSYEEKKKTKWGKKKIQRKNNFKRRRSTYKKMQDLGVTKKQMMEEKNGLK